MSMKPGATSSPVASIRPRPRLDMADRDDPSVGDATSARSARPVPSTTAPSLIGEIEVMARVLRVSAKLRVASSRGRVADDDHAIALARRRDRDLASRTSASTRLGSRANGSPKPPPPAERRREDDRPGAQERSPSASSAARARAVRTDEAVRGRRAGLAAREAVGRMIAPVAAEREAHSPEKAELAHEGEAAANSSRRRRNPARDRSATTSPAFGLDHLDGLVGKVGGGVGDALDAVLAARAPQVPTIISLSTNGRPSCLPPSETGRARLRRRRWRARARPGRAPA